MVGKVADVLNGDRVNRRLDVSSECVHFAQCVVVWTDSRASRIYITLTSDPAVCTYGDVGDVRVRPASWFVCRRLGHLAEYTSAVGKFMEILTSVSQSKDFQDVLGDSFVDNFCEVQPEAARMFTSMVPTAAACVQRSTLTSTSDPPTWSCVSVWSCRRWIRR